MATVFAVDGFNLMFRAYYAVPDLSRSDGLPTNAVHGWVKTLWRLEDDFTPDQIIVFFDLGGSKERQALYPEYKANRGETPETLLPQIPIVKEITKLMGYSVIEKSGVEADDLIASFASSYASADREVVIVSADKDLAQCLNEYVSQLLPPPTANPRLGWRKQSAAKVPDKFGVQTHQIVDYLSLIGDSSDNIPGIQGVGPKTAAKWLTEYGTIEGILESALKIKPKRFQEILPQSKEQLVLNRKLVQLDTAIDIQLSLETKPDGNKLYDKLIELEMKTNADQASKRYRCGEFNFE